MAHYNSGEDKDISTSVTWSVSKTNVASINNKDRVIGKIVGDTLVTARLNDMSGQASLTIDNRSFYTAEFIPDPSPLTVGDSIDIKCMATYGFPLSVSDPIIVDMTEATKADFNTIACMLPNANGSFTAPAVKVTVTN